MTQELVQAPELTAAVQDYAKAIYSLETRDGTATTNAPGERGTFVRVSDADPEMLRFLAQRGIAPGASLEVVERQPFDGPVYARSGGEVHVLGATLARAMRVSEDA